MYVVVEGEGEGTCPKRKHACILRGSSNETRISRIQESASVSMGGIPWRGGDEKRFGVIRMCPASLDRGLSSGHLEVL